MAKSYTVNVDYIQGNSCEVSLVFSIVAGDKDEAVRNVRRTLAGVCAQYKPVIKVQEVSDNELTDFSKEIIL